MALRTLAAEYLVMARWQRVTPYAIPSKSEPQEVTYADDDAETMFIGLSRNINSIVC